MHTQSVKGEPMYCLTIAGNPGGCVRSAEIAQMIVERQPDRHARDSQVSRHLSALERLESRGVEYSNQDFDVLSAALRFANGPVRAIRFSESIHPHCHTMPRGHALRKITAEKVRILRTR